MASTELSHGAAGTSLFDSAASYRLSPDVALRPEPFGALTYHYGTRRLNFLRSVELARVVEALAEHDSAAGALTACGVADERRPVIEQALGSLLQSGIICAR